MEYKFNTEFKIEICAECPCVQYDGINETNTCGINNMLLNDTEEKDYHCPMQPVNTSIENSELMLDVLKEIYSTIKKG